MQIFITLIYLTFFLIYIVNSIPIAINSNIYNKINLNKDITEIFLKAENYHYITVEIFFSHASRYYISFNEYAEQNNSAYKNNQTDLIIKSELKLGKNKVLLKNINNQNGIILSIFLKENQGQNDFVYIKYTLSNNIEENKFTNKNNEIYQINSEKLKNDEKKEGEKSEEEEVKENLEKNKMILFIFLGSFLIIILITFIIISIHIKKHEVDNDDIIEEDQDYSNIGGITNATEKDDTQENIKNEGDKIN